MDQRPVQIVAVVTGHTTDDLCAGRRACAAADIVEMRLDGIDDLDLPRALAGETRSVIAACRPAWEGGHSAASDADRLGLLAQALDAGARWIEVEWHASVRDEALRRFPGRVIVSLHDFDAIPPDLADTLAAMASSDAAVVKVAVTPRSLREAMSLAELRARVPMSRDVAVIGMGPHGAPTRVAPSRFGSCWAYGVDAVAPGQYSAEDLAHVFRVREQSAATTWYGLIGHPVAHSVGPWMHNAGLAAAGLDAVYVPADAIDFADAMAFVAWMPLAGLSVTAPYKRDAAAFADTRDALTQETGAANTLFRTERGWLASNFDVEGFLRPLREHALEGGEALVLGAGGAARAVIVGLHARGMRVTIAARRREAAEVLARELGAAVTSWPPPPGRETLLVNSTPVGTWPDTEATPLPGRALGQAIVCDLVYNPEATRLLRDAAEQGCVTVGGLGMLVEQAHEQFRQWTRRDEPAGAFVQAARAQLVRRRTALETDNV